jgi:hypothetical protein
MLIGAGQLGSITPLYLASEGEVIIKFSNTNLINAMVVLIASYYTFNVKYPNKGKNVYCFLEAILLEKTDEAKRRVAINRLMQEMDM